MGNGQSVGSGIGDIFWPDNPNRRDRAFQLEGDCRRAISEFNDLKMKYDKDAERVKFAIEGYLRKHGFTSVQQLDQNVQNILEGEELQRWQDLKQAVGTNNIISDIVMAVSGVAVVAGGITIGALVLAGIMAGPAGWAALGTIGTIAAAVGAVVLVWGIIEGGIERFKLRDAINDLFDQRQKAYVQLRTLQTYSKWIARFELFFLDEDLSKHPEKFEKEYKDVFRQQADQAKPGQVAQELREFDQQRHSWTNEDPEPNISSMVSSNFLTAEQEKPKRHFVLTDERSHEHYFHVQLVKQDEHNVREQCVIEDVNSEEKWTMKAEIAASKENALVINLQDVSFTLVRSDDTSIVLEHCKLSFPVEIAV